MGKIASFIACPLRSKLVLFQVFLLLPFFQLCAVSLSLSQLIKAFRLEPATHARDTSQGNEEYIKLISWAIQRIQKNIPLMHHARCLAQALTVRYLLRKKHIASVLLVGVQIEKQDQLAAHAWIVCNNMTINFGSNSEKFTEIARFY